MIWIFKPLKLAYLLYYKELDIKFIKKIILKTVVNIKIRLILGIYSRVLYENTNNTAAEVCGIILAGRRVFAYLSEKRKIYESNPWTRQYCLGQNGLDQFSLQFGGFYRFGKLPELVAAQIASGGRKSYHELVI